jgi:hypothetical protein
MKAEESADCAVYCVPGHDCAIGAFIGGVAAIDHASARPRSYGQRLELVKGTSPRGYTCRCADEVSIVFCGQF